MTGQSSPTTPPSFRRPLPKTDGVAAPYWQALRERRIELPRCEACAHFHFPPRAFCPHCHGRKLTWQAVEGRGRVYTFTVVHKPTLPYFMASAPYVYALVELGCGIRLPTMLVDCPPDAVRVGDVVEPVFVEASDAVTLLHFRPARPV